MINNRKKIKEVALCLLCLNTLLVFLNPDSYLGIADYYIFFTLYIFLSFFSGSGIRIRTVEKRYILTGIVLIVAFINAAIKGVISTGYIFSYLLFLMVAFVMVSQNYTSKELNKLLDAYVLSAVFIAIILFLQRYDYYGGGNERHTIIILSHDAIDPNFLAAYMVVPCIIAFSRTIKHFDLRNTIMFLCIIAGTLYTSSRGALLSVVAGVGIILFSSLKGEKKLHIMIASLLVVIICVIVAIKFLPNNSILRLININSYYDNSNAKRLLDWKYGLSAFRIHPIMGYGLQGEMSIIKKMLGVNYISHNTYIALLLQFGIIGATFFSLSMIHIFLKVKNNITLVACLVSTLIVAVFISGETAIFFWLPIIYLDVIGNMKNELCKNEGALNI